MQILKNSLSLGLYLAFFGCQTNQFFEIKNYPDSAGFHELNDLQVVSINTDRIKHECYFMNAEAENNWRHQYFMYILNDKNEVISVMYPTNQGDAECLSHLKKVEKILKKELKVKMCLRGEYKKDLTKNDTQDFGKLGEHRNFYGPMDFDTICNSKECYSINETWNDTCPGFVKHDTAVDKTRYNWEDNKVKQK